jgi:succinate dehydrogenase/fumarate reductase cytochrome b subunit
MLVGGEPPMSRLKAVAVHVVVVVLVAVLTSAYWIAVLGN